MLVKTALAMVLLSGAEATPYKSGHVKTNETFKYGKFKARIKSANKKGTVTSFFTFWEGQPRIPGWNEIDVELVPSITDHSFSTNIISENQSNHQEYISDFVLDTEWHDYAILWTPEYISWFIDGK